MEENPDRFEDASPMGVDAPSMAPAIAAGAVAAVVGGVLWAVVVRMTGYEIGYAAVGLGALVGFAMSRTTRRRDLPVAIAAALLALGGLVTARVAIAQFVMPRASIEGVLSDPDAMVDAVLLDLEINGGFPEDLETEYEAIPPGELIPDGMYERMWAVAEDYEAGMTDDEREQMARQYVGVVIGSMDIASQVTSQLTLFDLLWVFLALSTAWKMMNMTPAGTARATTEPA